MDDLVLLPKRRAAAHLVARGEIAIPTPLMRQAEPAEVVASGIAAIIVGGEDQYGRLAVGGHGGRGSVDAGDDPGAAQRGSSGGVGGGGNVGRADLCS